MSKNNFSRHQEFIPKPIERAILSRDGTDDFARTIKKVITPHLQGPLQDIQVAAAWKILLKEIYDIYPTKNIKSFIDGNDADISERLFSQWRGITKAHREIAVAAYYIFKTSSDDTRIHVASEIDKELFGAPFEEMFGVPVPTTKEEARALDEILFRKKQNVEGENEKNTPVDADHTYPSISLRNNLLSPPLRKYVVFAFSALALVGSFFLYDLTTQNRPLGDPKQVASADKTTASKPPGAQLFAEALEHEKAGRESERTSSLLQASHEGNPTAELELAFSDYRTGKGSELEADFNEIANRHSIVERAKDGDAEARYFYGLMLAHGLSVGKSPSDAANQLQAAALQGIVRAAVPLSIMILENDEIGTKCDGFAFARSAVDAGWMIAKWISARYLKDFSCPRDMHSEHKAVRDAISLLSSAIEASGHAESQNLLGVFYKEGIGFAKTRQNDEEAVSLFKQSASQGNLDAKINLGIMHVENRGVTPSPQNDHTAVNLFDEGVKLGNARSQHALGWMYMHDRVKDDKNADDEAVRLFELAVSQGYVRANSDLAWMYRKGRGVEQNDEKAVRLYQEAAETGNTFSQVQLAYMYRTNQGVKNSDRNKKIAFDWYKRAAEKSPEAQYNLGRMYLYNQGVPDEEDIDAKALDWFQKSAAQDYPAAINALGVLYEHGRGVERDLDKAFSFYSEAARLGDTTAKVNLGWIYTRGEVVEKKYAKALEYFSEAEKEGDKTAIAPIGWLYANGYGVKQDPQLAFSKFKEAADSGDSYAQFYLGQAYRFGFIGKPINFEQSAKWYKKAADNGDVRSLVALGDFYETGQGVTQSDEDAVRYYGAAAAQGNVNGLTNLGWMYKNNRGVRENERNDETAVGLFEKAAEKGYSRAQYNLALMYMDNRGVPESDENDRLAVKLLQQASDQDNAYARFELARMYAQNRGVLPKTTSRSVSLALFEGVLKQSGMWELRKLAYWNTMEYKDEFVGKRIRDRFEIFIEEKEVDELSELFGNNVWYGFDPNDGNLDLQEWTYDGCEIGVYYRCLSYPEIDLLEKIRQLSDLGMWEANITLLYYYSKKEDCVQADKYFQLVQDSSLDKTNRFKVELPNALGYASDGHCKFDVDIVAVANGVFEAAYEGYADAYHFIDDAAGEPTSKSSALSNIFPGWIEKLEKKSLENNIPELWSIFGNIYARGGPGIEPQPLIAEVWYKRSIAADADNEFLLLDLALLYVRDFAPPRTSEAVELISNSFPPKEAIYWLEYALDNLETLSIDKSVAPEIKQAIVDIGVSTETSP